MELEGVEEGGKGSQKWIQRPTRPRFNVKNVEIREFGISPLLVFEGLREREKDSGNEFSD